MTKQSSYFIGATAVFAVGLAVPASAVDDTIKIGVTAPLTGSYASAGADVLDAAKIAADAINAKGGVLGRKIEIIGMDDQCDAQVGTQAAQKLVESNVVAVAGGYCSSAAIPGSAVFHQHGIPSVWDASTNPRLTEQGFQDVFRTIGRDDEQGPFAADFIKNFLHAQRIAIVHDNTVYARGLADQTKLALGKLGGVDIVYFDAITPGQSDYTSVLSVVKADKPDVIYFTGYYPEGSLLVKEARALRITTTFMGGDSNQDAALIKVAGPAADGMIITTAPLAQFLGGAGVQDFIAAYKNGYKTDPGPYSVYEYDSIGILADAMTRANSTQPAKIIDALKATKDYPGLSGKISFNAKGDRTEIGYITLLIKNGEFTGYKRLQDGKWVDVVSPQM